MLRAKCSSREKTLARIWRKEHIFSSGSTSSSEPSTMEQLANEISPFHGRWATGLPGAYANASGRRGWFHSVRMENVPDVFSRCLSNYAN